MGTLGPGEKPNKLPEDPWHGKCGGTGQGDNTFTSGFELPWTKNPVVWSNDFFTNLKNFTWIKSTSPADNGQWEVPDNETAPVAPTASNSDIQEIGMLTSDVALPKDPYYLDLVNNFAENREALDFAFKHAWYKLTTRDMGPVIRCLGPQVPPTQPWQFPLPPAPEVLVDFFAVESDLNV